MKKYITPHTEAVVAIYGSVICHSQDGNGQFNIPGGGTGGSANGAPARRVF